MGQLCYGSVIAYRCARKAYNHPIRNHFGFLPKGLVSPDKVESLFLCAWQHSVPTLPSIFQSWWPSTCQTTCLLFQKSVSKCDCTDSSPQDFPIKASKDGFWGGEAGRRRDCNSETWNLLMLIMTRNTNVFLTSPSIRSLTSPSLRKRWKKLKPWTKMFVMWNC